MEIKTNRVLEEALKLVEAGCAVIPLHFMTKKPVDGDWYSKGMRAEDEVRKIFGNGEYNMGVLTGSASGFVAVDFDGDKGMEAYRKWVMDGKLPATVEVSSGNGGKHLYYKLPDGVMFGNRVGNSAISPCRKVDVKCEGGFVVGAGSVHPNGGVYVADRGIEFGMADIPQWLEDRLWELDASSSAIRNMKFEVEIRDVEPDREKIALLVHKEPQVSIYIGSLKGDKSASEYDMSLANICARNGYTPQEVVDLIVYRRKLHKAAAPTMSSLQHTLNRAEEWAEMRKSAEEWAESFVDEELIVVPVPEPVAVNSFPVNVFPSAVVEFAEAVSRAMGSSIDFIGVPILAVASIAIGKKLVVELVEGYRKYPNIYCAVVGKPGTAKTPNQKWAVKPIEEIQKQYAKEYAKNKEEYLNQLHEYKAEMAIWKQGKRDDMPKEPKKVLMCEVYTTNATVESLIKTMGYNLIGLGLILDELSWLMNSLNQYKGGKGGDLEFFLSTWANKDIKMNRVKDDEPIMLDEPYMSIIGNLPTDLLPRLRVDGVDNGFMDRFLISFPDDQNKKYFSSVGVPHAVYEKYRLVIDRLHRLKDEECGVMRFDANAYEQYLEWDKEHTDQMNSADDALRGPFAKMPDQILSISIILHALRFASGEGVDLLTIDDVSFMGAWKLINYFKTHAAKVYTSIEETHADQQATKAIEKIKELGGEVTLRDAVRMKIVGCKKRSDVEDLFDLLADFGYGTVEVVKPTRGRSTKVFRMSDRNTSICY